MMHVIATAGHVDHGKSTLVRRITGSDPDRLSEEKRRGLTIELGYAWTSLDPVGDVAFVDVPGHKRFISTTLAGVGPVPAVLLVVAADDPWMPQAAEHLATLDALGVSHGVVAVSRSDLADPDETVGVVHRELAGTSLQDAAIIPVSGHTGLGLDALRAALVAMVRRIPDPDPDEDVRLWADRAFSIPGSGTIVTGTLASGTIRVGDSLRSGSMTLRVRGLQTLGAPVDTVSAVSRVAVNLAGADTEQVGRHSVLVTPDAWHHTEEVDVLLTPVKGTESPPPERPLLHVGAARVSARCRLLSDSLARLRVVDAALPLRVGDRAVLRDPGDRQAWAATVLDPAPPSLRRRGAAARRAASLAGYTAPDIAAEVDRREVVGLDLLRRIGIPTDDVAITRADAIRVGDWLIGSARADAARDAIASAVASHERDSPLAPGIPLPALARRVGLPNADVVRAVIRPPVRIMDGRASSGSATRLPMKVTAAVEAIRHDLANDMFAAPNAGRLRALELDDRAAAAAAREGLLFRPAPGIVLPPEAEQTAVQWLSELPQPFTMGEARSRLNTTRRVAIPLLEHLARAGLTRRLPDSRHEVISNDTKDRSEPSAEPAG